MTIYEGYALLHTILRLIWLAVFFQMKFLTEHRYTFTTTAERGIGCDVKEKLCYMSFDYDTELTSTAESSDKIHTYELPDRNIISPGAGSSSQFHWHSSQWTPRHFFPEQHEVLRKYPQGVIRQCRVSKRHDHVPKDGLNV